MYIYFMHFVIMPALYFMQNFKKCVILNHTHLYVTHIYLSKHLLCLCVSTVSYSLPTLTEVVIVSHD